MALQNRVDPFGAIHADSARGTMMGNRGILHDPKTKTLLKRRWTTKAWIICVCVFRGRHRQVMAAGSYTELFFLDEATALAAGHRPCFECRNAEAKAFAAAFAEGNDFGPLKAAEMDAVLHRERCAAGAGLAELDAAALAGLPDGAMIAVDGAPHLLCGSHALPWSFGGYGKPVARSALPDKAVRLVTPPSTVAALAAGYRPASPL